MIKVQLNCYHRVSEKKNSLQIYSMIICRSRMKCCATLFGHREQQVYLEAISYLDNCYIWRWLAYSNVFKRN